MRVRWIIASVIAAITAVTVLLSGVSIQYKSEQIGSNTDHRWSFDYKNGLFYLFTPNNESNTQINPEDISAINEHANIINAVLNCLEIRHNFSALDPKIRALFPLPPNLTFPVPESSSDKPISPENFVLSGYHRSILQISERISSQRSQISRSTFDNRHLMQWLQIATVIIGAITTIIVGIKTGIETPHRLNVLAVIFAAIGTAISSMTAFYNPREEYARSIRINLQLSQLQNNISYEMISEKACKNTPENMRTVGLWYSRLSAINSGSSVTGQTGNGEGESPRD